MYLVSTAGQEVDFALIRRLFIRPIEILNSILLLNYITGPGNFSAFYDLKLTQVPILDGVCKSEG